MPRFPESSYQGQGSAECTSAQGVFFQDAGPVSEEEVSLLLADVVPTTSRLQPHAGRTRAIARTRQSERVRATVNRNRIDQGQGCPRVAPEGTEGTQALRGAGESEEEEGEELSDLLELLYCRYETQEGALVHQALRGLPELALE